MEYKITTSIPIRFEKLDNATTDNRFTPVKIFLCHTNENLNGSFFSKEVLDKMKDTLGNIPILGYISLDNYNDSDFNGHEQRLVINENGIDLIYVGRAYGLIPETHNGRFEMKLCEDGIEREFLVCDGFLWNKFQECIDIFDRDGTKSQSMELEPKSIQGSFQKDGLFHFTEATCEGACILGTGVTPAMTGSVVEKYTTTNFTSQINELKNEFVKFQKSNTVEAVKVPVTKTEWKCPHCFNFIGEKELYYDGKSWFHSPCQHIGEIIFSDDDKTNLEFNYKLKLQEGGNKIVPENILALLQKYSLNESDLTEKGITYSDFSIEELEVKISETFQRTTDVETETPKDFTLTSNQLQDELRRELAEIETLTEVYWDEVYTYPRFYYRDCKPEQNTVIAMDDKNRYLVGLTYSTQGDSVEIDASTCVRYKFDYIPMDLNGVLDADETPIDTMTLAKSEFMIQAKEKELNKQFAVTKEQIQNETQSVIERLQTEFAELQQKYADLEVKANQFELELSSKAQVEREQAEAQIFESFSVELTEEEMKPVKEKASTLSLEDITEKLFSIAGKKKVNFSLNKTKDKPLSYQIPVEEKRSTGKAYDELFEKFNKKNEE